MNKSIKETIYSSYLKRFIDFNLSLIALIFLSPLLLFVAILQILFNGFPIFFTQERVGKNEKIFKLIKFRSMTNKKDKSGLLLTDNKRKTWFGKFLRASSIDELPSLFNILKGDMALIGPRPLLVEYLPLYSTEQRQRHLVRPGLSGLAQIKGRNLLSWKKKFEYDVIYLNKVSFFYDLKILFFTFLTIIFLKPIDSSKSNTMERFKGNQ
jgi:lipopolysaccharide/colanic/teichoic acid biosynthesis glycosyltransferase